MPLSDVFSVVSFQTYCILQKGVPLPCEVGIVEASLSQGILREYHAFIDPGPIPLGYGHAALHAKKNVHGVPFQGGFELAQSNYAHMWSDLSNLLPAAPSVIYAKASSQCNFLSRRTPLNCSL